MVETGRCIYYGSEDVVVYADGTIECLACGMMWKE